MQYFNVPQNVTIFQCGTAVCYSISLRAAAHAPLGALLPRGYCIQGDVATAKEGVRHLEANAARDAFECTYSAWGGGVLAVQEACAT